MVASSFNKHAHELRSRYPDRGKVRPKFFVEVEPRIELIRPCVFNGENLNPPQFKS
jgi:hypothetical protein